MKILIAFVITLLLVKVLFLWFEQKSLYYPHKTIHSTPKDLEIAYEDIWLSTSDGERLHAWYVAATGSAGAVLFCHGNAGNISDRLHRVEFFRQAWINLLLFDYRGYGKSTGRPSEKGLYADADAAYAFLTTVKNISPENIIVYGKSLGCAVAVDLGWRKNVGYLILESPFSSVLAMARDFYPFLPAAVLVSQKYDNLRKIKETRIPTLIVHGRQDEMISVRHAERIYQAAAGPKELIYYAGGHNDIDYVTSAAYLKKIANLIGRMRISKRVVRE